MLGVAPAAEEMEAAQQERDASEARAKAAEQQVEGLQEQLADALAQAACKEAEPAAGRKHSCKDRLPQARCTMGRGCTMCCQRPWQTA